MRLCAADPLNLAGIVTPGPRVPAIRTNTIVYRDGLPVDVTDHDVLSSAPSGSDAMPASVMRPSAYS